MANIDTRHEMNQRNSEYELADMLEDDTLRVLDDLSLNDDGTFPTHVRTIYLLLLGSTTAADHLLMGITTLDGDPIAEIAIDWLKEYGASDESGEYFYNRIVERIANNDYMLKED